MNPPKTDWHWCPACKTKHEPFQERCTRCVARAVAELKTIALELLKTLEATSELCVSHLPDEEAKQFHSLCAKAIFSNYRARIEAIHPEQNV